jgi:hypothetical protein
MSETMRMWVEIIFNLGYLAVVWGIVIAMALRSSRVSTAERSVARSMLWAFALLALGDSGHVGLRVIAYALGDLEAAPLVFGLPLHLVGLGALTTAITVTLFYMLMVNAWRLRYGKPLGWAGWVLLATGVARLILMAFPQNRWDQVVAPYNWSLGRNALLTVQGVGVMLLILRDSLARRDRPFIWIGIMIALSFIFYAPVILWVQWIPMLGMLMIPKTCAYVGIAVIAYGEFYRLAEAERRLSSNGAISGIL